MPKGIKYERTNDMSKTKRALPEDFSVLDGSELDGSPDAPDDLIGHTMWELSKAVSTLEQYQHVASYFADELSVEYKRIKKIFGTAGKSPF